MKSGMPMLKEELVRWAKNNHLPCQMDRVLNLAVIDARKKQEKQENALTEEDFYT